MLNDTTKEYNGETHTQCSVQHLTVSRELKFGNFKFYRGGGGERG